jgi:hypothetical protein
MSFETRRANETDWQNNKLYQSIIPCHETKKEQKSARRSYLEIANTNEDPETPKEYVSALRSFDCQKLARSELFGTRARRVP